MMRTSGDVVERFYEAQRRFYAGEAAREELEGMLADEVVWHVPGRSAIAGTYRGRERVLDYFDRRRRIADQTFRVIPREMVAEGDRVVHFADGEATIDGRVRRWRTIGLFAIRDGRIAECRLLPFDQYDFDDVWGACRQPSVRWQRGAPEAIRSLDTLASPDYVDMFTAAVSDAARKTPDQWRAVLEDLPGWLRRFILLGHRYLLGLRLQPRRSPDRLLDWRMGARGERWLRIETAGWFLTAHLVFHADAGQVSVATFVRYDRPIAAILWPPVSLVHRQVGLAMMRRAARIDAAEAQAEVEAEAEAAHAPAAEARV
jgi:ketosteroid isomerase-like protein